MPFSRPSRDVAGIILVFVAYYLGAGMLIPYFPLWLNERQMSPVDIAVAISTPAILRVLAAPLFGYVGDNFGKRRMIRVMGVIVLASAVLLCASTGYWPIVLLTCITYVCWQSMPLQMDGIVIALVRRKAVAGYGFVRAFGSTAFIVSTFAGPMLLGAVGADAILFYFIAMALALLLATTQVRADVPQQARKDETRPVNVWLQPRLVSVMVAAAMVHGAHAAFMSFGALHMRALGFGDTTIGVIFALATGAEIMMFFFGHRVAPLLRPIQWIALGSLVAACRWTATAFITTPEPLMALQLVHALTFSATYMGVIAYMVESVDQRQVASAQGIYIAMFGIFSAGLTFAVGSAFAAYGGKSFLLSTALPLLSLTILSIRAALLRRKRHDPKL